MPLKKILFKPGVNRENTRYTTEGGWYECDKVRFRQGTPEKIGGWERISDNQYLGVARSLWPWSTLAYALYLGVGTHLKYYIMYGGGYNDITPLRATATLGTDPFTGNGTTTVVVTHTAHGATNGDFVTFSGTTGTYATLLNAEFQITYIDANSYSITTSSVVAAGATGGSAVSAAYQISVGNEIQQTFTGWGSGPWGSGGWGIGVPGTASLRVWNNANFGEDLLYGPKNGPIYYWDASTSLTTRGTLLSSQLGASDVPAACAHFLVSDASRFVLGFGVPDYGGTDIDPMLIRWTDQETAVNWTPAATNQAGSLRLSRGSRIVAVAQVRQEILVWTDVALYSLQYLGPPIVWGSQLLADNVSIVNERAWATAAGVTYWMGDEKFYVFDGRTQTLECDLRQFVFSNFNYGQVQQVFASTVEQFSEVWWFYCSADSTTVDRYVVYNYAERIWYYGTLARTAWIDASIVSKVPLAAAYTNKLNYQETGVDDEATPTPAAIDSYITSSEFDIDDGHNFGFVWRVLPDVTFRGSTAGTPAVTVRLLPLQDSGSGYTRGVTPVNSVTANTSVAGTSVATVARTATSPIERYAGTVTPYTGNLYIRVRGRQMSVRVGSAELGTQWQLGALRIDVRPDGRKS